jgi:hypothetical protein
VRGAPRRRRSVGDRRDLRRGGGENCGGLREERARRERRDASMTGRPTVSFAKRVFAEYGVRSTASATPHVRVEHEACAFVTRARAQPFSWESRETKRRRSNRSSRSSRVRALASTARFPGRKPAFLNLRRDRSTRPRSARIESIEPVTESQLRRLELPPSCRFLPGPTPSSLAGSSPAAGSRGRLERACVVRWCPSRYQRGSVASLGSRSRTPRRLVEPAAKRIAAPS